LHRHEIPKDLTKNQTLVLDALELSTGPLSAYDLLDKLRSEGLRAPLQVYRALDKLVERGLAHRLESLNAFVACADAKHHHHEGMTAFAICAGCGKVDEFADAVIERQLGAWAEKTGFRIERTTMEIRGMCAACLKQAA
jgi:Fur family zinc uptake transcriptional regulator